MVPPVDTASHSVETPTWGSYSQRQPGTIWRHPQIRNRSTYLRLQQTGNGNGDPPGRYYPARCGNPNLGFVDPGPPGEDNVPPPDHESFHTSTTPTQRGRKRWSPGSIPARTVWNANLLFVTTRGGQRAYDQKYLHTSTTPTNRERKRWFSGRYRPARCGNPNHTG